MPLPRSCTAARPFAMRLACTAAALCLLAPAAHADNELGVGYAQAIDGEPAPVLTLSHTTHHRHAWEFLVGYVGQRREQVPDALLLAASKRVAWGPWFISGGVAWVSEDNEVLSGHGQFMTGAGWRGERWTLSVRHLSNADTGGRNRGETFLLLQYAL